MIIAPKKIISKNGKPHEIVLDLETFENLCDALEIEEQKKTNNKFFSLNEVLKND